MTKLYIVFVLIFALLASCNNDESNICFENTLTTNWQINSSEKVKENGFEISKSDYDTKKWYNASVPTTVLNALVENKVYENIFLGDNLQKIPTSQFNKSWWFRTEYNIDDLENNDHYLLKFEGINYRANIWLNGKQIGKSDSIESAFRVYDFDISDIVKKGKNVLAVEVFPPEKTDLTIGFVDWNPPAPDKNMGIWRQVKLIKTKEVALKNIHVLNELNVKTLDYAELQVKAELENYSDTKKHVDVNLYIGDDISIVESYELEPKQKKTIVFSADKYEQLKIKNPQIWWPNNLGEPNLYNLNIDVKIDNKISDKKHVRFGIREISEYLTDDGYKAYKINGKNILIKGAGWVDDILLSDSPEKVEAQMQYVKSMNLNTIRLEGFWGNDETIFNKADELGILVMLGWSCHWEWEGYCNREELLKYMSITSEKDIQLQADGYRDQVIMLRNHPSVFLWTFGSDKLPVPELEQKLNEYIKQYDDTRPILASCKYRDFDLEYDENGEIVSGYINNSTISGATGVKMRGPYAYVSPNYWYLDTNGGGAFGFNTETGPGPQVPPLESIKKMIPADKLWPTNKIWDYHSGRNEFKTLERYNKAFYARYGDCDNVEDYAFKSQISNYEAIRAMFEAFEVNKYKATGVIQWMLNSAWPEMFWQLYDWYLMPNGAFYGTKTACQPLSLIYNYKDESIYLNNEYNDDYRKLKAQIKVLDLNSKIIEEKSLTLDIDQLQAKKIYEIDKDIKKTSVYFIDLRLTDINEKEISRNFYWLSTKKDVLDFENSEWFMTPFKQYADFTALNSMPKAKIDVEYNFVEKENKTEVIIDISNNSHFIAFFINFEILGSKTGTSILPVFFDDNYISLLPGESRQIRANFKTDTEKYGKAELTYKGFNLK